MANISDLTRDQWMLRGPLAKKGYDWWWHSLTAENAETGEKKAFYVEFFTCNPGKAKKKPVIVWNDEAKQKRGIRPSYLMVNVGFWGEEHAQLHRFFSWDDVKIRAYAPYKIVAGDCYCSETLTRGSVTVTPEEAAQHPEWMSDAGSMSWNLEIDKEIAFHVGYGAGEFFRRINAFEMFWHAEGMATEYQGHVIWNGRRYVVRPDDCFGYADKNWGKDFTSPWVWLSSCNLTSELTGKQLLGSVFDIGGGCPKVGPIALPRQLLSAFWYEGQAFEFNFSKFWTFCRTNFDCKETDTQIIWHVDQRTWRSRMITDISCEKNDMLLVFFKGRSHTI